MKEDVADGERGGIERVPVAVDDAGPLVGAHEVADVHVGYGVAVDLVPVVESVAEGDERGEEAVEGPKTTQPVGERGGLRRVESHAWRGPPLCLCFPIYHRRRDEVARDALWVGTKVGMLSFANE